MAGCASTRNPAAISTKDSADSLEYIGRAVKKENTSVWGTRPIVGGNSGKNHLFATEDVSLFERQPPHFSTAVYRCDAELLAVSIHPC